MLMWLRALFRVITQITFVRQRVYFGFDIGKQFSFNVSEAPVVDIKRLVG